MTWHPWSLWVGGREQVGAGDLAERRHQPVTVAGAGGDDDVAGLDVLQRDRGEVGAEPRTAEAFGHDRDHFTGGDQLQLVLHRLDQRATRRWTAVRAWVDPPERVPVRVAQPRH